MAQRQTTNGPVARHANLSHIDSWHRGQNLYPQARHYTPGRQYTEHRVMAQGVPREMPLMVVLHDDAGAASEGPLVDLMVHSGGDSLRPAEHANAHLVNDFDEQYGITRHTRPYVQQDLDRIIEASASPAMVPPRSGSAVPGARVYSVWARVAQDEQGRLMVATDQPMRPGRAVDPYCLYDAQEGMNLRAAELRAEHTATLPSRPVLTPQSDRVTLRSRTAVRGTSATASQPALATAQLEGERETSPSGRLRMPTAEEISSAGRVGRSGVAGAMAGAKAGSAVTHPVAKAAVIAGGAVIGAGRGIVKEADRRTMPPEGVTHQKSELASQRVPVSQRYPYKFETPQAEGAEVALEH